MLPMTKCSKPLRTEWAKCPKCFHRVQEDLVFKKGAPPYDWWFSKGSVGEGVGPSCADSSQELGV